MTASSRPVFRGLRVAAAVALGAAACVPHITPITGTTVLRSLPGTALPDGHHLVVFTWTLEDPDMLSRGEGTVRTAAPDSARVDFFLGGGLGSGAAVLIGPELRLAPGAERVKGLFVPPAPLLWAVAGRAAPPALPDTVIRVDGDTLRVDIGKPRAWRLTFAHDSLRRVERVNGEHVVEWVSLGAAGRVRYRNEVTRRQLDVVVVRTQEAQPHAGIWTLP
ncbi:MAG: hypothetical protein AABZ80_10355 [Gemmatimonadota bacterium]